MQGRTRTQMYIVQNSEKPAKQRSKPQTRPGPLQHHSKVYSTSKKILKRKQRLTRWGLLSRQDFAVFHENLEVHYHVHKSPLFYATMSQVNQIHIHMLYCFTNFNIAFPFIRKLPKQFLPFRFSSSLPLMLHCEFTSSSLIWVPLQCLTKSMHYEVPQHQFAPSSCNDLPLSSKLPEHPVFKSVQFVFYPSTPRRSKP